MTSYIRAKDGYHPDGMYEFIKEIELSSDEIFTINIFASTRYTLYINDEYVCEGPCRSSEDIRYYDTVTTDKLRCGKNIIRVLVMHTTHNMSCASVFKAAKPILIMEARSNSTVISTDDSWKCLFKKEHKLIAHPYMLFVPPFENVIADGQIEEIEIEEFSFFDFDWGFDEPYGCVNSFHLVKRPIPMIYPTDEISFRIVKEGENFVEFDAGCYVTAKIEAELKSNSDVKIIYSECYQKSENEKEKRDDSTGYLSGPFDIVRTGECDYTFKTFWFRAFRFIRIEGENVKSALLSLKAFKCIYPLVRDGSFECSDENYNKMYDISVNTMQCSMHEIFVDCPHYEQQQYIMDSSVESAVLMRMSSDVRMIRKCISEFAASQHPSGLLPANYPCSYIQIIPGFSFFFVFLLRSYMEYSGDLDFCAQYIPVIDKMFAFFDKQIKEEGYIIAVKEWWNYVDWVPGWERGTVPIGQGEALTIYNLYYACALKDAKYMCEKVGRIGLAEEYGARYEQIKKIINENCFDSERGLYRNGSKAREFSMHTIMWAVLAELVEGDEAKKMMSHIFDEDLAKSAFAMNYFLLRALEKCGCYDEYAYDIINEWQKMIDLNCTTWCENPDDPRSECHGWSSAPLYEFSANILGVKYSFDDEIVIAPKTGNLKYAKGTVPTRFGIVYVEWNNEGDEFNIKVKSPNGLKKKLILPNGTEEEFLEEIKEFKILKERC